jgi:hypothetical protein
MDFIRWVRHWWGGPQPGTPRRRPRTVPCCEPLEVRQLLACHVISGYVYHDANNNGLFDPGETPLAGSTLELVNSGGQVIATAVSGADGSYAFSADQTIPPGEQTVSNTVSLPEQTTNWTRTLSIPRFDPALGTLTEVEIINQGDLTGQIRVESEDRVPQTVTGTVSGTLTLSGPGVSSLVASSSRSETFNAAAYDHNPDFAGPSGHDFGPQTVSGSKTITLTDAADLARYTGGGSVSFTEKATGTSSATSTGGNLLDRITEQGEGSVTVVYHFLPNTCLKPGSYTIVQVTDPAGYVPGMVTRGNVVPVPGSLGSHTISVTLAGHDLTNNDFAELLASSLSGYVYYDVNHNGVRDPGDPPILGTPVTLTGVNDLGQAVSQAMRTLGDGSYSFGGLRPGSYTITETQPAGYLEGTNNVGSLGGTLGNDQFFVAVGQGQAGVDYNFGEVRQTAETNAPRTRHRRPGLSKNQLISDGSAPGGAGRHRAGHRRHGHPHHPHRRRHP